MPFTIIFLQLLALPFAFGEVEDEGLYISVEGEYSPALDIDFNVTDSPRGDRGGLSALDDSKKGYSLGLGGKVGSVRTEARIFWIAYNISDVEYTYYDSPTVVLRELNESVNLAGELQGRGIELGVYYDFDRGVKWVPYVGGGVGKMKMEFNFEGMTIAGESYAFSEEYEPMTFFVRGGLTYKISPRAKLDLSYTLRRVDSDDFLQEADSDSRLESEGYESSHVALGLRVRVGRRRQ